MFVTTNSMKEYRRSGGTAPLILNLDTTNRIKCSNSTTPLIKFSFHCTNYYRTQNRWTMRRVNIMHPGAPTSVKRVWKLRIYIHLGRYVKCVWHCASSRNTYACSTTFP